MFVWCSRIDIGCLPFSDTSLYKHHSVFDIKDRTTIVSTCIINGRHNVEKSLYIFFCKIIINTSLYIN